MAVIMVQFNDSAEAEEQRRIRRIIRKIKRDRLTKSEREILMVMVNLWFYHRNGPKGYVHPGCDLIAKKANVAPITVKRGLARLRDMGVIIATAYEKGGRRATRYTVNIEQLCAQFDPSGVRTKAGRLVKFPGFHGANDTVSDPQNDTVKGYQNDTLYKGVKHLGQAGPETDGGCDA